MKKQILWMLTCVMVTALALILVLSFAACGSKVENQKTSIAPVASTAISEPSASATDATDTDKRKIEDTIRKYISTKEDIISRVGKHDFSEELVNVKKVQELVHGDAQKNKIAVVLQMQWNHLSSQSADLSYADYHIEFEFGPVGIYKNVATDKVNVTTYINFAFNPSEESKVGNLHTVDFEKVGDTWLITNDDYLYNEYSNVYDHYEQEYLNDNVGGDYSAMNDYILSKYRKDIDQSSEGQ